MRDKDLRKEFGEGARDYTCNGKCSNCGNCCIPHLPITMKEYDRIRRYIKKHHIKQVPTKKVGNNIYLNCPFRDYKTKKCTIYPVRPEVCRNFICSKTLETVYKDREYYDNRADINGTPNNPFTPMDLLFYGNPETLFYLIIKMFNPKSTKQLKRILVAMQHKDIADLIDNKTIKIEWKKEK